VSSSKARRQLSGRLLEPARTPSGYPIADGTRVRLVYELPTMYLVSTRLGFLAYVDKKSVRWGAK